MASECDFSGQTVLIAGAGCAEGEALAAWFADRHARLVAIDRDEPRVLKIAALTPARIEPLRIDVMRVRACEQLGEIWADEPVRVLIHLQILRHAGQPAEAMHSVRALTRALGGGLAAGQGRVVFVFAGPAEGADAAARGMQAAFFTLAQALQDEMAGARVSVNALMLPPAWTSADAQDLCDATGLVTGTGGARIGGAVIPLLPRCR